ncbi:DUF3387 domain-containing protein [Micromonospora sp. NBC_01813]|nr:type I restriction enzyme endonuclease domain-containing protein [Micromonospora sp. NBC_01813]WSA07228.1 DUF3387 domain-containing protein [Micromonospora sp. NBC_01813]
MNRYMRQQLTSAQLIVELVELAKEVSADARRGQLVRPTAQPRRAGLLRRRRAERSGY